MNIEQQWQAAKEEFKDNAFKRFKIYHHGYGELDAASNEQIEGVISQSPTRDIRDILKTKPLPELFAHDVSVYGENSFQMWEVKYSKIPPPSNDEILNAFDALGINKLLQRKKSAALPFDLERAKTDDVCEIFKNQEWLTGFFKANNDGETFTFENSFFGTGGMIECVDSIIRMKYPPRLKK